MALKTPFLTSILAHVPEADRATAEKSLGELEEGNLRQAEFSKLANDAKTAESKFTELYTKNTEWFEARNKDLQELDGLRAKVVALEGKPNPTPASVPATGLTKEEFDKAMMQTEQGAVAFIADANKLSIEHYKTFGEPLDLSTLLADKRVQQLGIRGVYQEVFKPQLTEKATAIQTARDEALRKEGADAALKTLAGSHHPYPVVGNEASSLDAIEAARTGTAPVVKTVDDMTAEYVRLQGARAGV